MERNAPRRRCRRSRLQPEGAAREDVIIYGSGALVSTLADPVLRQKLVELSQEIFAREQLTPEALLAFHKAEIEKWWPIVKAANIKAE